MKNIKYLTRADFDTAVERARARVGFGYPLKKFQTDVLFKCITERLVISGARTGSGKSAIYILLPSVARELQQLGYGVGIQQSGGIYRGNTVLLIVQQQIL